MKAMVSRDVKSIDIPLAAALRGLEERSLYHDVRPIR
jgi:hypothetical protein